MPNHCECRLTIGGRESAVRKVLSRIKSTNEKDEVTHFDCNQIIPMPESLEGTSAGPCEQTHEALFGQITDATHFTEDHDYVSDALIGEYRFENIRALNHYVTRFNIIRSDMSDEARISQVRACEEQAKRYEYNIQTYGCRTWYDWAIENWGTKWGAYDVCVPEIKPLSKAGCIRASIRFDSAWGPPEPVIRRMIEMFPKCRVTLRYWEGGAGFQGKISGYKGKVTEEYLHEYHGRRGG